MRYEIREIKGRDIIIRDYADDEDAVNHAGYCAICTGWTYHVYSLDGGRRFVDVTWGRG